MNQKKSTPQNTTETVVPGDGDVKRLSLILPVDLHRRIKLAAARRGTSMIADIIDILQERYPPDAAK